MKSTVILTPGLRAPDKPICGLDHHREPYCKLGDDDWWRLLDLLRRPQTGIYGADPRGVRDLLLLSYLARNGQLLAPREEPRLLIPHPKLRGAPGTPLFFDRMDALLTTIETNLDALHQEFDPRVTVVIVPEFALLDGPQWSLDPDALALVEMLVDYTGLEGEVTLVSDGLLDVQECEPRLRELVSHVHRH